MKTELRGKVGRIRVCMNKNAPVEVDKIPFFLNEYGGKLRFQTIGNPEFILKYDIDGLVEKDEILLLEKTEELLQKMQMLYEK